MARDVRPVDERGSAHGTFGRIVAIDTFRPRSQESVCFVQLHTDAGEVGLGEAFMGASAVEAYIHDVAAGKLGDIEQPTPEHVAAALQPYVGYQGSGAETRGNGAIDVALWDILGQRAGLPLVDMFGGAVRDQIDVYNTCAGPGYVSNAVGQSVSNWGLPADGPADDLQDLDAFLHRPAELARDLKASGVKGMKIWPFDVAAERSGGLEITAAEMRAALDIVEAIRSEVGMDMHLMIELHGLWYPRAAQQIMRELEPYRPYWVEDPLRADAVDAMIGLHREVNVPIALGETGTGRRGLLPLIRDRAIDVLTLDIGWTGGITEARKLASLADTYLTPIAPHDCTGPVSLAIDTHLVCNAPNGLIQETARAFLATWYPEFTTGYPEPVDGVIRPTRTPGHGVKLRSDFVTRADVIRRTTRL
ncbi:mandelate racemase/muconate lactonizing enzyme family protein [Microbacterium rhizosphaerae]